MKIGYVKIFARDGRIMLANSDELNKLLEAKGDYVIVTPFLFEEEGVQIRKVTVEEFENMLPNVILTSPYEFNFGADFTSSGWLLNKIPFNVEKLQAVGRKLVELLHLGKSLNTHSN